jgi:hypothetical protein
MMHLRENQQKTFISRTFFAKVKSLKANVKYIFIQREYGICN